MAKGDETTEKVQKKKEKNPTTLAIFNPSFRLVLTCLGSLLVSLSRWRQRGEKSRDGRAVTLFLKRSVIFSHLHICTHRCIAKKKWPPPHHPLHAKFAAKNPARLGTGKNKTRQRKEKKQHSMDGRAEEARMAARTGGGHGRYKGNPTCSAFPPHPI